MLAALQPTMSIHMCGVLYSVNAYLGGVIILCAEAVFIARACAIWEHRRGIVILFLVTGAINTITAAVVLSIGLALPTITEPAIPVASCFDISDDLTIIMGYVILAVAEIKILVFTVYKAAKIYWREGTHNRLLEQLVHHNVVYVTCGLVFSVAVILTTALVKEPYGSMISKSVRIWQVVVHAFLVTKMHRELWKTDRRRALLESFTFSLATFHAAPGMLP
ncbi:hypothetical protein K503DRAFT_605980 [Rhizopogon vinicolor AM-OR11-026]|uniref:G-protein coupled receptors family 1 profile domain-containing protein n=1 Tax=Rhizopogon vinicolor AM-OR11-026 TaxID=1314800 RepID=A0A1B7MIN1_9AGAM|nr:hypothetical protein K503DRAFT_605980 [Rhizopogon vinicolor AM-OR11-026]